MGYYFYETPATTLSLVVADGTTQTVSGPNVALEEFTPDAALGTFGGSLVAHAEQFGDRPLSAPGWPLPSDEGFPDIPAALEWEF